MAKRNRNARVFLKTQLSLSIALVALATLCAGCAYPKRAISLESTPLLGNGGARTEVVVFSDFQCPFCKSAARELQRLMRSHPNRVKVYFKHFPLAYHPFAVKAAHAAEAARLQGKFEEMHDQLFAHAQELNDELFIELAKQISLDIQRFQTDLNSPEVAAKVQADIDEGERLGVNGTPFFFINRKPFHGSYADLNRAL